LRWDQLRERINRSIRPDTEILSFHVRGGTNLDNLIVWMTPRTSDPKTHTAAIIASPPRKAMKAGL